MVNLEDDCKKAMKKFDLLSEEFESFKKEKARLEKEFRASEAINQSKSDELVSLRSKLTNSEDVQERLRGQIVKDAN